MNIKKNITIFTLAFLFTFFLKSQAPSPRILQSQDQEGSGDLTLPPNSFAPTDYYTVYYELAPPGNITFAIQFDKPDQFFGLGLGKGMFGADIWAFQVINGQVVAHDYHGVGMQMPVLDTNTGGQENLQVLGSKATTTSTFIKFTRALNTNDTQFDKVIQAGPTDFIWATAGGSPNLAYHGSNKGTLNVNLVETPVSSPGETELGGFEEEALLSEEGQLNEEAEGGIHELEDLDVGESISVTLL